MGQSGTSAVIAELCKKYLEQSAVAVIELDVAIGANAIVSF